MIFSSHAKRWFTSLLLLPLLAMVLVQGGWWLFVALALVSGLALVEFYGMFWPGGRRGAKLLGLGFGLTLLLLAALGHPLWGVALLCLAFWLQQLHFLFHYAKEPHLADYRGSMVLFCGLVYIPAMLQFFLFLQPMEILLVLLATFASDTGAYYAGSYLGRRKLWPVISPKKTWAGSCGGLAACLAVTLAFAQFWGGGPWVYASLFTWLILGLALNLAAQFGDFFESALKRSLDVKDSGSFLPGHGGMLDRIDALLLTLPVYMGCRSLYLLLQS